MSKHEPISFMPPDEPTAAYPIGQIPDLGTDTPEPANLKQDFSPPPAAEPAPAKKAGADPTVALVLIGGPILMAMLFIALVASYLILG